MCGIPSDGKQGRILHHIEEGDSGYEKLKEIFLEIHTCHTEKKPYFYVKLKMLFFDFFYEMLTRHYIIPVSTEQNKKPCGSEGSSGSYQPSLSGKSYSFGNFPGFPITVNIIFMKLFSPVYGKKTLVEYINDFRMEKAKYLLTHSDAPVTEIAMNVGFNSTSYFIKKISSRQMRFPHIKYRKSMGQSV